MLQMRARLFSFFFAAREAEASNRKVSGRKLQGVQ